MTHAFHKRVRTKNFEVGQLILSVFSLIRTSTKESSHLNGRVLTWFIKYYLEVLWSCRKWMVVYGQNLSTQMRSRDTTCEVSFCIFLSFTCNHFVCLYSFRLNSYPSCNELCLTLILENEIRRQPISASVTPYIPFKYLFVSELRST